MIFENKHKSTSNITCWSILVFKKRKNADAMHVSVPLCVSRRQNCPPGSYFLLPLPLGTTLLYSEQPRLLVCPPYDPELLRERTCHHHHPVGQPELRKHPVRLALAVNTLARALLALLQAIKRLLELWRAPPW